jgi:hypothetical protein
MPAGTVGSGASSLVELGELPELCIILDWYGKYHFSGRFILERYKLRDWPALTLLKHMFNIKDKSLTAHTP